MKERKRNRALKTPINVTQGIPKKRPHLLREVTETQTSTQQNIQYKLPGTSSPVLI